MQTFLTNLASKIEANRRREARNLRAERTLRQIRQRIFDYEDESPEKYAKARRIMATCQRLLAPKWEARRKANEDRRLQATPSYYEPGGGGTDRYRHE